MNPDRDRTERGRRTAIRLLRALGLVAFAAGPLLAQTHKVAKPETVVRAVGVYEWTGEMAKPAASRLKAAGCRRVPRRSDSVRAPHRQRV